MERVDRIGGVFFPAADPEALSDWYETHLGIRGPRPTYEEGSWWQSEGPTVLCSVRWISVERWLELWQPDGPDLDVPVEMTPR
jgi:hypothetical protein